MMNVMRNVGSFFRTLAAIAGTMGAAGTSAQPMPPDSLFGIRLGQPLEAQLNECPKNEKGEYALGYQPGDKACWIAGRYGKEVRLPLKLISDNRIGFDSDPRVRVSDGVVVEITAYADGRQWREVERYMIKLYGKPHESKTYERDSRVSGLSTVQGHTWRAKGITLYFDERSSNERTRIYLYDEAWQAREARELEKRREERQRRGNM